MPRPSQAAVEAGIRSLSSLDYSPNVSSEFEALLVALRVKARDEEPKISVVDEVVGELFGVLPDDSNGRLSPFRRQGNRPPWGVQAQSGRKTVWNAATRQNARHLFDGDDFRKGLRSNAIPLLVGQVPQRTVRLPDGSSDVVKSRPTWQALAALFLRDQEFPSPPDWVAMRAALELFLGVKSADLDQLCSGDDLGLDPGSGSEWSATALAQDLRPASVAVALPEVTVRPGETGEEEYVVIEERTRRMLRLALQTYSAVLLVGPPGTGKGTLLRQIIREIRESPADYGFTRTDIPAPVIRTPDESWTAFDLLGGLSPDKHGELKYASGFVLDAIAEDRWLILDETNRADLDKIFGPLLTWLAEEEVEIGRTRPGAGRRIMLGWQRESAKSAVEPTAGLAADDAAEPTDVVRFRAGREWRLLGTYNPLDAQRVFRFGQALSRRFVTVPIPALSEEDFALLLDKLSAALPEQARFSIRGLYGAHLEADETALGPAVFLRMAGYLSSGLGLPFPASADEDGGEAIVGGAEPEEGEGDDAGTVVADDVQGATGSQSEVAPPADGILSQLVSEAYVLSVGRYLGALAPNDFELLGQRVTVDRKLLPPEEWTWISDRRKEIG